MRHWLVAGAALLAGALAAQSVAQSAATHRYSAAGDVKVEVQTLTGRIGPFPHSVRFGEEVASVLNYTDEIALDDADFLGNARSAIVPGSRHPVAVFQLMPASGADYSATMTSLCGGLAGIPFIGLENGAGSMRKRGFDAKAPTRLYVFEETFAPGRVVLRLCKAIDLAPA
ncbi:MAG: hypothetical protein B7Y90_07200 [Alphaproteobacteria bacterium 32-64-14]|nr:MAG: hypothetical protein B7Y90_07200 [Alphaproteobacteria bacterium 32-64-14]